MLTVRDVSELTGLSTRQVYDRLSALSPLLDGGLRTGQRGRKLITDDAFALFRRLRELEGEGNSRESAVSMIRQELDRTEQQSVETSRTDGESGRELIAVLEARIAEQAEEIRFLRAQLERLLPLALPRPRRWWLFGRKTSR